ncbi:MAG: Hsp70 family protein [Micromonosporaceae bacterium]
MSGVSLSIDFGTSTTVAMVRAADGRVRPLIVDGSPLLPSAVYADATGGLMVGADALHMGGQDPARLELHPKLRVDDGQVLLGERAYPVADLIAAVLRRVVAETHRTLGAVPPAVLTHPAGWGAARRQVLRSAAAAADLGHVTLASEPVAAAALFATRGNDRRPIAVFDLGAGTCDVAVLRHGPDGWVLAGHSGLSDLGGADVDAAVVDHLARTVEHPDWAALRRPRDGVRKRAAWEMWAAARAAKENLSTLDTTRVRVPGLAEAVPLRRSDLEAAARPLAERAAATARAALRDADVKPADLGGLYLVGGGSRMPLFGTVLTEHIGVPPVRLEQPELAVAEGALAISVTPPTTAPRATPVGVPAAVPEPEPRRVRRWPLAVAATIVALAVATGTLVWWGGVGGDGQKSEPEPMDTSIRRFDFRNVEWTGSGNVNGNERFRLRDGVHSAGTGGSYELTDGPVYIDLDRDRDEDAAVELTWRSSGRVWAAIWYVWTWDGRTALQGDYFAGSGTLVTVDSVKPTSEGLRVKERRKTADDALGMEDMVPSEYTVAIRNEHLVRVAPRLAPRDTCDPRGREVKPKGPVTVRAAPARDGPVIAKDTTFRTALLTELRDPTATPSGWALAAFDNGKELVCGWVEKAALE